MYEREGERGKESAQISARSMNVNKDLVKLIITPALNLESRLSERNGGGTFYFSAHGKSLLTILIILISN